MEDLDNFVKHMLFLFLLLVLFLHEILPTESKMLPDSGGSVVIIVIVNNVDVVVVFASSDDVVS